MAIRILGLDPGLSKMGWGIIDVRGSSLLHVEHGTLTSKSSSPISVRLLELHQQLEIIVQRLGPDEMAVEMPFVHKDPMAALKIGYARATALLVGAQANLRVSEYTPNLIKKSVTGAGHATKEQIQFMVRRLLPLSSVVQPDAADALAVAITRAHLGNSQPANI